MKTATCFARGSGRLAFILALMAALGAPAAEGLQAEFYSGYKVTNGIIVVDGLTLVKSEVDTNLNHPPYPSNSLARACVGFGAGLSVEVPADSGMGRFFVFAR